MVSRVLIANRGEIALRVIRACRALGLETVAVYSTEDKEAIYLRLADQAICIGPAASTLSYLDIPRILSAAEVSGADAIHPGYGFLSENAAFAEVCQACGFTFVGPTPETLRMTGDKNAARRLAQSVGVPVTPGSEGTVADEEQALRVAHDLGYPVMIKAAHGGGGRGMREADGDEALIAGLKAARAEAEAAFKSGEVYLEKLIVRPRHIEIQVLADAHGHVVHLGERDCSLQRRHQKLLEESPALVLDDDLRGRMGADAVRLARAAGYRGVGTVEFLLDREGRHHFMELNARIQVEHPVTEMVTGIDLVQQQLKVAAGETLPFAQGDIRLKGAAIECRINAENPDENFKPVPGVVTTFFPPAGPGVRVDTHVHSGYRVSPYYDSMLAKLIVWRDDRPAAIAALVRALEEFVIDGIPTTRPLFLDILRHELFVRGETDTRFVEDYFVG